MLKSLVRVSRRVNWIAEQLVTDLRCHSEAHSDAAHPPQSGNTVRQSSPVERREGTEGPCLEKRARPYLDPQRRPTLSLAITLPPRREAPSNGALTVVESVVTLPGKKCADRSPYIRWSQCAKRHLMDHSYGAGVLTAESIQTTLRLQSFTSKRFHVLLNSLFKVLFNFPSRYLFAIGLVHVFSLRWSLPPALGCILKQPDSKVDRGDGDRQPLEA